MSAIQQLLTDHIDIWTAAEIEKKSGRGRASSSAASVYGIKKLRELILDLAIRGKLVRQDHNDDPASGLLTRIQIERNELIKEGKIKNSKTLVSIITEDVAPFRSPIGWQWVRLADLFALITDGDHQAPPPSNQGVPFLVIGNLNTGHVSFDGCRFVSEKYYNSLDWGKKPTKNDILYTVTGSYGIPIIVNVAEKFCVQRHVAIIKSLKSSPVSYLGCVLGSKYAMQYASEIATGIAQKTVPLTGLRELLVPMPPLAEQHRIVAKVRKLMALCDQLEAQHSNSANAHEQLVSHLLGTLTQSQSAADFTTNWQRIAEHFDTLFTTETSIDSLKQTLLQLAVMGKLVAQDANDEPASEFLKHIQAEKSTLIAEGKIKKDKSFASNIERENPYSVPISWQWITLDEISQVGTGATPLRTTFEYFNPPSISWVTSGETSNSFIFETEQYVSPLALNETNLTVYPRGTLIVAMYGQGKTRGQVTELMIDACTNQACAAIQLHCTNEHHRKYVKLFFEKIYDEIRELAAGGAQPNLNLSKIKETLLPLPPLAEQHRIVAKVDELMALCDQVRSRITTANQQQKKLADVLVEHAVTG